MNISLYTHKAFYYMDTADKSVIFIYLSKFVSSSWTS